MTFAPAGASPAPHIKRRRSSETGIPRGVGASSAVVKAATSFEPNSALFYGSFGASNIRSSDPIRQFLEIDCHLWYPCDIPEQLTVVINS